MALHQSRIGEGKDILITDQAKRRAVESIAVSEQADNRGHNQVTMKKREASSFALSF